jgi:hypothetical protein
MIFSDVKSDRKMKLRRIGAVTRQCQALINLPRQGKKIIGNNKTEDDNITDHGFLSVPLRILTFTLSSRKKNKKKLCGQAENPSKSRGADVSERNFSYQRGKRSMRQRKSGRE